MVQLGKSHPIEAMAWKPIEAMPHPWKPRNGCDGRQRF